MNDEACVSIANSSCCRLAGKLAREVSHELSLHCAILR